MGNKYGALALVFYFFRSTFTIFFSDIYSSDIYFSDTQSKWNELGDVAALKGVL